MESIWRIMKRWKGDEIWRKRSVKKVKTYGELNGELSEMSGRYV